MIYNIIKDVKIDFSSSIVGFEHLKYFKVEQIDASSPFWMLQSEEDAGIGFVVVSPFEVYPDYEFKLSDEIIEVLRIEQPEQVAVYTIVTMKSKFTHSTINLVAPIVINISTGMARQFILNHSNYPVNAPLFPLQSEGE
ncbi:flagellar assembly protein FliW [Paenibacillus sp. MMS18-CY102]|uniref:flagellar assembly protein FliW n=1 Tax=Paenibacillus sp. MMS18-CY102 TaxID=2682849 RepID=UPI001365225A|nr:flagellar assembly protein FliW [Paenibacillus sp. MMS18-CY102]